ncbi:metalloproteinase inhibitor 3-like [Stylophora pistillata]|uniref:Metalloproteinase inhibitor 3 n=1 Tax=Stylophora pistillata TaxID=50429 RepID=A0A2B4T080_STYPI|nr:metalloproteinase inhibitor 3-like [Stylophora pistillata]PFX34212.1 Metalloproteinase inhibitor 3 [Stylophora pistillata]
MSHLLYITLLLGAVITIDASQCSCPERHPQEAFCGAQFVIRAKVLSQEEYQENFTHIFDLRILKTYKGGYRLHEVESVNVYGSRQRSLFAKAYTFTLDSLCGVKLNNNKVYLISGQIKKGKLELNQCHWNQEWSQITVRQRLGVMRFYRENCACQISPCYTVFCNKKPKLRGCGKPSGIDHDSCEWGHSYCLQNAEKTACSWRKTTDYKSCITKAKP